MRLWGLVSGGGDEEWSGRREERRGSLGGGPEETCGSGRCVRFGPWPVGMRRQTYQTLRCAFLGSRESAVLHGREVYICVKAHNFR